MSELRVSQERVPFALAKSVQLSCPKCGIMCEAVFPWGSTHEQKIRIRHQVITEHVKVCTQATGEVERIWTVEPPRA